MSGNNNKYIKTYATKDYVNNAIANNSGVSDYNDLENRPCYDTRVFETITSPVVFNGDLTDKTIVEIVSEVNAMVTTSNMVNYFVKISDTAPVVNGELFNLEVTTFDTYEGEVTSQIQNSNVDKNDSYIFFGSNVVFVYNEFTITTYAGECTLTPGIWFYGMQTDGYELYTKNYNMIFLLEGEFKKLPSQFVDYMPGKNLEGETFVVSIAQTASDGYPEQVDNVERIAQEGSEIFNDYRNNKATGEFSHSEGTETMAVETGAHAEGAGTKALGYATHAEGNQTSALGNGSHSEGIRSIAIGGASHSEGYETEANGERSHTEGENTKTARGTYFGHAEGSHTEANGKYASHAEGYYTKASSNYQHVQGKFNIEDVEEKYAHIVGNGKNNNSRTNAHTLDWDGNAWFQGNVSIDGTPTNDNHLATKKYVDDNKSIRTVTPSSFVDLYNICKGINMFPAFYKIQPTSTLSFTLDTRTVMVSGIWQVAFSSVTGRMTFVGTSTECSFVLTADGFNQASIKYLTTNNTVEYTPTQDYHPATKKYVDNVVANATPEIITEEDINAIIADIDN